MTNTTTHMNRRSILTLFLAGTVTTMTMGQSNPATSGTTKSPCDETKTSRPQIMVIPQVKHDEDIRKILENDFNLRIAVTKVQEAFNNRGFTTVDFLAKLAAAEKSSVFNGSNVNDYQTQLLNYAAPDIYVTVEYEATQNGGLTIAKVILKGYDTSTGNNLGSKTGNRSNQMNEPGLLVEGCLGGGMAEDFLNTMQTKFTEMLEDGRQVAVTFMFNENSAWKMDSPVPAKGDGELQTIIEDWVSDHAVKHNYQAPRATENALFFDDIRIPIRNPVTCRNYTTTNFGKDVIDFLNKDLAMTPPAKRVVDRATITVTIN